MCRFWNDSLLSLQAKDESRAPLLWALGDWVTTSAWVLPVHIFENFTKLSVLDVTMHFKLNLCMTSIYSYV